MTDFGDIAFDATNSSQKRLWPFGIDDPQYSAASPSSHLTTQSIETFQLLGSVSHYMPDFNTCGRSLCLDHQCKSAIAILKR